MPAYQSANAHVIGGKIFSGSGIFQKPLAGAWTVKGAMMKLFYSLLGIYVCGVAYAQQLPVLPSGRLEEVQPGVSTLRPEYAMPPTSMPPANATAAVSPRSPQ